MRQRVLFSTLIVVILFILSIVAYVNSFSEKEQEASTVSEAKDVHIEANEVEASEIAVEIYAEPLEFVAIDSDPMEDITEQSVIMSMELGAEDRYLLAKIAMAEAESEDTEGKALVILVVLNRVWSDDFPNSIEEVIYQSGQFSPISNGRFDNIEPDADCWAALDLIMIDKWDESCGATYFESESESSWHSENLDFLFQHGKHYFYTDREEAGD